MLAPRADWWTDADEVRSFVRWMHDFGWVETVPEALDMTEKPWHWDKEHAEFQRYRAGAPNRSLDCDTCGAFPWKRCFVKTVEWTTRSGDQEWDGVEVDEIHPGRGLPPPRSARPRGTAALPSQPSITRET